MRVAVVGSGYWGANHIRVLTTIRDVSAVVCVDPALRCTHVTSPYTKLSGGYATLSEALPEVDAVVIATPPTTHAELALESVRAGRHVLVEKPFTTTVASAREVVRAGEEAGVVVMAGHTYAYNSFIQKLRTLIQDDALGELYYMDSNRLNLGLYRPDVSVLWDLAAHDVAIMNLVQGSTPDIISARSGHRANRRFDDVAYMWLEYNHRGIVGMIHVSWLDPCKVRRLTVVGSDRMAVYDDMAPDEHLKLYDKGVEFDHELLGDGFDDMALSYRYGKIVAPFVPFEEPLLVEDRHFVECILEGRTPITDGYAGLAVVEALTAADESLRRNQPVTLDDIREHA